MLLKERGFLVSRRGRTLRLGPFVVLQVEQDWLGLFGRLTLLAAQFENIAPKYRLLSKTKYLGFLTRRFPPGIPLGRDRVSNRQLFALARPL